MLARHLVVIPETWTLGGPFQALAPLPLDDGLVQALYKDVGLHVFSMTLLLGVGMGTFRTGLRAAGGSCKRRVNHALDVLSARVIPSCCRQCGNPGCQGGSQY